MDTPTIEETLKLTFVEYRITSNHSPNTCAYFYIEYDEKSSIYRLYTERMEDRNIKSSKDFKVCESFLINKIKKQQKQIEIIDKRYTK
jgi:hypothetical protein